MTNSKIDRQWPARHGISTAPVREDARAILELNFRKQGSSNVDATPPQPSRWMPRLRATFVIHRPLHIHLALLALLSVLLGTPRASLLVVILVVLVLVEIVLVLVIFVFKVALVEILAQLLKLERLAGEPVDGAGDQLFLNVLAEGVVELETLFNVAGDFVINVFVVIPWRRGRAEEVEKGVGGHGLLDDAGLLGVW